MYCFDFEFYLHISAIEREAQTWPQDYRPSSCLHPVAWRHRRVAPVTPWEAWNLLRAASGRGRLVLLCDQSVFWPLASAAGLVVGWGERPVCTSNLQNKNSWDQCLKKVDLVIRSLKFATGHTISVCVTWPTTVGSWVMDHEITSVSNLGHFNPGRYLLWEEQLHERKTNLLRFRVNSSPDKLIYVKTPISLQWWRRINQWQTQYLRLPMRQPKCDFNRVDKYADANMLHAR